MTTAPKFSYSYTTSWAVGRRLRSDRRTAAMSRRCAGAYLAISARNSASAARRATAGWLSLATSISTFTDRRAVVFSFTLIWLLEIGLLGFATRLKHRGTENTEREREH